MFDHVGIRVSDFEASRRFYVLALGEPTHENESFTEWREFGIARVLPERALTERLHVAFRTRDRAEVDRWWERMTAAGYRSDGEPGERPQYSETYYGAFVLDPDGNSAEAVHHDTSDPEQALVDHLWLRTRSVANQKRFYETIGSVVGISLDSDKPDFAHFSDGVGSFSFVAGDEATQHVHLAFGVRDRATVDAFHRAATVAGYTDNGAPGERPIYHPGYYGAFVLDPDGHNVEAVFHDRK